jgi:hypothetical protein
MTPLDYISSLKYDTWYMFDEIPEDIKTEVIEIMDASMDKPYTFVWELWSFKKCLNSMI